MEAGPIDGYESVSRGGTNRRMTGKSDFSNVLSKQVSEYDTGTERLKGSSFRDSQVPRETRDDPAPVSIGTVSRSKPTVSNLLIKHPVYGKDCWRIIHSEINRSKPFTRIQPGTTVYLNPETLEISWQKESAEPRRVASGAVGDRVPLKDKGEAEKKAESFSPNLAKAVAPYLGKSYKEINCYGLVVRGLKKLGIRYQGNGGLQEKLIKMAVQRGQPKYAYLNGEGIIKASGSEVYSKSISKIRDSETESMKTLEEVEPLLEKGFILSFSTPTRGHTGIVSRRDDLWTYINSGNMDHQIGEGGIPKGVGEESLSAEVKNWFRLAQSRNEPLQISLGQLDAQKLAFFQKNRSGVTKKA